MATTLYGVTEITREGISNTSFRLHLAGELTPDDMQVALDSSMGAGIKLSSKPTPRVIYEREIHAAKKTDESGTLLELKEGPRFMQVRKDKTDNAGNYLLLFLFPSFSYFSQ